MALPAAVLSVLVQAEGIAETNRKLRNIQDSSERASKSTEKLEGRFSHLDNTVGDFNRTMTASGNVMRLVKFPALITGAGMAAQAIGALAAGAGALGAALAPLAGLGAAGAAAMTALAQAGGVAALAFAGVKDALKEQLTNHAAVAKAVNTGAKQQESSAKAVRAAHEGVRSALQQVTQAQYGLTQAEQAEKDAAQQVVQAHKAQREALAQLAPAQAAARRAIEDAEAALTHAYIDEKSAVFALIDAQNQLTAVMKPADALSVADAQDAVSDALRGQTQAALNLASAQAALDALNQGANLTDLQRAQIALNVTKAQDALNKVNQNASATDAQRQQAVLNLANAQRVLDASMAGSTATDAQKAQAALDVANAQNAIGDAARGAQHAQENLNKLLAPPDALAVAKAQHAVAEATQGVTDATTNRARQEKDTAAIVKAGVAGSAQVIAAQKAIAAANDNAVQAQRALVDAHHNTADASRAVKDALHGVQVALQAVRDAQDSAKTSADGMAGAAVNLNAKLDALPPAAQAFVRQLVALKPKVDDLRSVAASGLLPGVGQAITSAVGNFGHLRAVVDVTARTMGDLAIKAGKLVGSGGFGKDLEKVGRRNATIIGHVGNAAISLGDAFRHIVVAAGPLTSWLARLVEQGAKFIDTQAQMGRESGKMAAFFERTRSLLTILGHVVRDFGVGLFNVFKGGVPLGNNLLGLLEKLAAKFRAWTESVGGRNQIRAYFAAAKGPLLEIFGLIGDVAGALLRISQGKGAQGLIKQLRTLVPIFENVVTQTTAAFGPALIDALGNVLRLFGTLASSSGPLVQTVKLIGWIAGQLADLLSHNSTLNTMTVSFIGLYGSVKALSFVFGPLVKGAKALELAFVGQAGAANIAAGATLRERFALITTSAAMYASAAAPKVMSAATWALGIAAKALPFVAVIAAIAALAAGLIYAYKHSEAFRNIVNAVWDAIKTVTGAVWDFLTSLKDLPGKLWDAGKAITQGVINGIKALPGLLANAATWLWGKLKDGLRAYLDAYKSVGGWILARIIDGFKIVTDLLKSVGGWIFHRVSEFIKLEIQGLKNIGGWLLARIVDGFKVVTDLLKSVGGWVKNRVVEFIKLEISGFNNIGTWIVNRVVDGFKTVTKTLDTVGDWLRGKFWDIIKGVKDGFLSIGSSIVGWIVAGLKGGLGLLGKFAIDVLKVLDLIPGVSTKGMQKSVAKFTGLQEGGVVKRAKGGMVPGSGSGDKVPLHIGGRLSAMVEPGELVSVTNRNATAALMQTNKAIPRFATGGVFSSTSYGPPWTGINGTGVTATGVNLRASPHVFGVAVDPKVIALGQMLSIKPNPFDTSEKFKAFDTGSAIKDRRIDFYDWRGRAAQYGWGARDVLVSGAADLGQGGGGGVGDLLAALNPMNLIKKLPGVGGLPDWLQGTGKWVLEHVKDYITGAVSGVFGGGIGDSTENFSRMISMASRIDSMDIPYGPQGHSGWALNRAGEDCSSSVSKVLHAAGFLSNVLTTVGLPGALEHGRGKMVTVHDRALPGNAGHTIMQIGNRFWGTSGQNPGGGPGWFPNPGASYLATLPTKLHPKGMMGGGELPFLGSYHTGGVAPREGIAHVAAGERMTPAGGGPLVNIEHAEFGNSIDVNSFASKMAFKIATA